MKLPIEHSVRLLFHCKWQMFVLFLSFFSLFICAQRCDGMFASTPQQQQRQLAGVNQNNWKIHLNWLNGNYAVLCVCDYGCYAMAFVVCHLFLYAPFAPIRHHSIVSLFSSFFCTRHQGLSLSPFPWNLSNAILIEFFIESNWFKWRLCNIKPSVSHVLANIYSTQWNLDDFFIG